MKNKNEDFSAPLSAGLRSALSTAELGEVIENDAQKHQKWLESRRGKITGSNFGKLMKMPRSKAAKEAGELGETAKSYIKDVVSEILGAQNRDLDIYQFRWGKKYEPIAIDYYEKKSGDIVEYKGDDQKCFDLNKRVGATPDGIVEQSYGVEAKCPENATHHLTHLLMQGQEDLKEKKPDYYWQCVGGMLVTGIKKWHFISYYHFYDEKHRMKVIEIDYNQEDMDWLINRISAGKIYMDGILKEIGHE